ncbi:hypothetical protein M0802_004065 [Mischocyttarus mexicanus]|nr:hypothetical protein M0802_004065 [Mischocyttarus mexicanus]
MTAQPNQTQPNTTEPTTTQLNVNASFSIPVSLVLRFKTHAPAECVGIQHTVLYFTPGSMENKVDWREGFEETVLRRPF